METKTDKSPAPASLAAPSGYASNATKNRKSIIRNMQKIVVKTKAIIADQKAVLIRLEDRLENTRADLAHQNMLLHLEQTTTDGHINELQKSDTLCQHS